MLLDKLINLSFQLLCTCGVKRIACLLVHHMLIQNLQKFLIFRFKLNSEELFFFFISFERSIKNIQENLLQLFFV